MLSIVCIVSIDRIDFCGCFCINEIQNGWSDAGVCHLNVINFNSQTQMNRRIGELQQTHSAVPLYVNPFKYGLIHSGNLLSTDEFNSLSLVCTKKKKEKKNLFFDLVSSSFEPSVWSTKCLIFYDETFHSNPILPEPNLNVPYWISFVPVESPGQGAHLLHNGKFDSANVIRVNANVLNLYR